MQLNSRSKALFALFFASILIGILCFLPNFTEVSKAPDSEGRGDSRKAESARSSESPEAAPSSVAAPAPILPSAGNRREWALQLEQEGVRVEWDEKMDNPFSLRGKSLGVRPLGQRPGKNVFEGTAGDRALAVMENLAPVYGVRDARRELAASEPVQIDDLGYRHQRLAQQLLHLGCGAAQHDVAGAARRQRHHHAHRPLGPVLGVGGGF